MIMYVGAASSQPPFTFSALSHYAREMRIIRQDLRTTGFSSIDASCSHLDRPTRRNIMRNFAFAGMILALPFRIKTGALVRVRAPSLNERLPWRALTPCGIPLYSIAMSYLLFTAFGFTVIVILHIITRLLLHLEINWILVVQILE